MFYFLAIQQETEQPWYGRMDGCTYQMMISALGRKISMEERAQVGEGCHSIAYRVRRESLTHKVMSFKQTPKGGRGLPWQREQ